MISTWTAQKKINFLILKLWTQLIVQKYFQKDIFSNIQNSLKNSFAYKKCFLQNIINPTYLNICDQCKNPAKIH